MQLSFLNVLQVTYLLDLCPDPSVLLVHEDVLSINSCTCCTSSWSVFILAIVGKLAHGPGDLGPEAAGRGWCHISPMVR